MPLELVESAGDRREAGRRPGGARWGISLLARHGQVKGRRRRIRIQPAPIMGPWCVVTKPAIRGRLPAVRLQRVRVPPR